MYRKDFYFDLPSELIAKYPLKTRSESKLLTYNRENGIYKHEVFNSIIDYLQEGDLIVLNDSKVIPARLFGNKQTGGKVELLLERLITPDTFLAHIKASKSLKAQAIIILEKNWKIKILKREENLYLCQTISDGAIESMLKDIGKIPLPPYLGRAAQSIDTQRYQTVFARFNGSVAAPTAGLHFDDTVLAKLKEKNVSIEFLTMHIGAGTFQPVKTDKISDHIMHTEYYNINQSLLDAIAKTKAMNKKVVAVGTTVLRTLESVYLNEVVKSGAGSTKLFIKPGFKFKVCDALLTNFHLPESTLLMLVSAFIGYDKMQELYKLAIEQNYRFFSYGDACFLI